MIIVVLTYIALLAGLLTVHHKVPEAPKKEIPAPGVNLTEAWHDLQYLSGGFHPYNSRFNDEVHDWLLRRTESILTRNGREKDAIDALTSQYLRISRDGSAKSGPDLQTKHEFDSEYPITAGAVNNDFSTPDAVLFNDRVSNVTFSAFGPFATSSKEAGVSTYFEGTNIIVYIRGTEDEPGNWWTDPEPYSGKGGVLVNAHYDSVSTGTWRFTDSMKWRPN